MKAKRSGRILFAVFVLALVMGPGPGIWLVNPDPGDPEARRFLFGVPIVYAWAVFWLAVQGVCIVLAFAGGGRGESAGEGGDS
ncbi:MAG: hypothetical protein KDM91_04970 [Verrucomicrobiae bacterium]|nr:hypothetical protein [Verrucomicrobiae bacterium]MCP5539853.1 hypothetical protein [Akkermansiaceae bacterium]MCP5551883.1 hypothetical protein [Akkermansiaceae bacterium]